MFQLKNGIYLVTGAQRAALYDTNPENVYSINAIARQIIAQEREDIEFWQRLVDVGLAEASSQPKIVQLPEKSEPSLEFIWFEINGSDCNQKCVHCYAESFPTFGQVVQRAVQRISFKRWTELIVAGSEQGCQECQFIGGEPFLYKGESGETVLDLADIARQMGYQYVEVFTNATLLTPEKIRRIKALGLRLAVSLYSIQPEVHDAVTQIPGSFHKTRQSLEAVKEAEIPTRIAVILTRYNQSTVEETLNWIDEMGFEGKTPDVLRPEGRGDNIQLQPDAKFLVQYGLTIRPNFQTDLKWFVRSLSGNNCLSGKIAITECGDVLPCVFSRNQIVGNVTQTILGEVIQTQQLQTIWRTTKDHVLVCRDCEYRYACFDCRPISEAYAKGKASYLNAPYPRCTYNPYTGEWAKGTWEVNQQGKPFYNRSLVSIIQEAMGRQDIALNTTT